MTVPKECPINVGVVSASAVVAGFEGRTSVKSVSGEIVLDGVSGEIHANTVSGTMESRGLVGELSFKSVSGELTVAKGTARRLRATTVSGRITADLELPPTGHVTVNSASGTSCSGSRTRSTPTSRSAPTPATISTAFPQARPGREDADRAGSVAVTWPP